MEVAVIVVAPAASVLRLAGGVRPPMTSPKVVMPAVLTANAKAPFTAPPNVMFPPPVLTKVVATVSVMASPKLRLPVVVRPARNVVVPPRSVASWPTLVAARRVMVGLFGIVADAVAGVEKPPPDSVTVGVEV